MITLKLHNGIEMPAIGFGTYKTQAGTEAVNAVKFALQNGYRHIDTAAVYNNEESVGKGIRESGIARESVFLTSKLWNTERGYDSVFNAFEKTISDLQVDYLDLYLIHWPANMTQFDNAKEINASTWKAMEELYRQKKVKAIGISNFLSHHIDDLLESAQVIPMVNQIEYHPGWRQQATVDKCIQHNILVEAWSPLGRGRVLEEPVLTEIAHKYNKSAAQVCIRWCLQNNIAPLPKSVTESRILSNLDVEDFQLSLEEMNKINQLEDIGFSGLNPDKVDF